MKITESSRKRVWASILLMIAAYVGAVYWVYQWSRSAAEPLARLVPLATSLAVVPLALVCVLAVLSMSAKTVRFASRQRAARLSPEIREALALAATGEGDRDRLRWLAKEHSRAFELIFAEFLATCRGQVNEQLRDIAAELGLVQRWSRATHSRNFLVQKTALTNLTRIGSPIDADLINHPHEQTRIEAACALLASGQTDAPEIVFRMLPNQSRLGQILLADSLRPFAPEICENYLADGITSTDTNRATASLDLLCAWERWIPMEGFSRLLANCEVDVRVAALPALRYAATSEQEFAQEVIDLLQVTDDRIHAPAARAAASMGLSESMPLLLDLVRNGAPVAALAAAQALAAMGSEGRDLLEQEIYASPRPQYALHALEQSLVTERG